MQRASPKPSIQVVTKRPQCLYLRTRHGAYPITTPAQGPQTISGPISALGSGAFDVRYFSDSVEPPPCQQLARLRPPKCPRQCPVLCAIAEARDSARLHQTNARRSWYVLAHGLHLPPIYGFGTTVRPCRGAASRHSMATLPTTAMKSRRLTGFPYHRHG